jgi:hypothetical protein
MINNDKATIPGGYEYCGKELKFFSDKGHNFIVKHLDKTPNEF